MDKMQPRTLKAQHCIATKGRPRRSSVKGLWSALQTHLQGVDRAMLAIMPEKCRHRVALLSRLSEVKITRAAMESKSKPPPTQTRKSSKTDACLECRLGSRGLKKRLAMGGGGGAKFLLVLMRGTEWRCTPR